MIEFGAIIVLFIVGLMMYYSWNAKPEDEPEPEKVKPKFGNKVPDAEPVKLGAMDKFFENWDDGANLYMRHASAEERLAVSEEVKKIRDKMIFLKSNLPQIRKGTPFDPDFKMTHYNGEEVVGVSPHFVHHFMRIRSTIDVFDISWCDEKQDIVVNINKYRQGDKNTNEFLRNARRYDDLSYYDYKLLSKSLKKFKYGKLDNSKSRYDYGDCIDVTTIKFDADHGFITSNYTIKLDEELLEEANKERFSNKDKQRFFLTAFHAGNPNSKPINEFKCDGALEASLKHQSLQTTVPVNDTASLTGDAGSFIIKVTKM